MAKSSTRFSRRHLLALGTFLVPMAVLAVLGWNELQRSGQMAEASLRRETRLYLESARLAVAQQFERQVTAGLAASQRLLEQESPTRCVIRLREEENIDAALDVLLLDEQGGLLWPSLATYTVSLPLLREPRDSNNQGRLPALVAAEVLLANGKVHDAMVRLEELIATLQQANPPRTDGSRSRSDLVEAEVHARFRLAAALKATNDTERARSEFRQVEQLARRFWRGGRREDMPAFRLLAQGALAELGTPQERIELLKAIAENEHRGVADGLAGAVAKRLAATFTNIDPMREEVDRYLLEEDQRAATREFAGSYELWLRGVLRMRILRSAETLEEEAPFEENLVVTIDDYTSLVAVRRSPPEETKNWRSSFVAVHFDFNRLIEPALRTFVAKGGNFVLAVSDPDGVEILPRPSNVPSDYVAPLATTNGLTLRVYPVDLLRTIALADSAQTKRALMVLALILTALGGALWSWRSVSREAELAALKIDLVSRVSHELKTPLALIRMYGETIGMGRVRDSDQASEFGTIIARESERLTTLIQRILDFSRQQAGTLTYSSEPHDIGESLRTTAYAYAPHLEEKGVILIDSLPLGIIVDCDKDGLEGAIVNLLENATKYGQDGDDEHEVDLLLQTTRELAVIEVRDRGRGIPNGEHKQIFDGFYRASNSGEVRGAGLGLGIVQHFARSHDGDIEALPREGGGTIMRLTLPLARRISTADRPATHRPATHHPTPGTHQ